MVSARRGLAGVAALAGLAGCDLGSTTIPLSEPQVVVHAILNPSLGSQTVLLEESMTGKKVQPTTIDPNNPITATGGLPISGAVIRLTGPEGARTAGEVKVGGRGTGIYTITGSVQPGAQYSLTIDALGHTVTGSTIVPRTAPPLATAVVPFNRDHQSVSLPIANVDLARAYWVRVEAPFSAFNVFTTDRDVAISGDTRNLFTDDLLRVFFPGFEQTMTVVAVDTNLYDYYRSGNDPFSGVGLISHLKGGIGLFGAMALVERRILDVTKDSTEALEGTYTLRSSTSCCPQTLRVYVESKGATEESGDRISGTWSTGSPLPPPSTLVRGGFYGRRSGDTFDMTFFDSRSTVESHGGAVAIIRGDTLQATVAYPLPNGGVGVARDLIYVRQGK
jgi:hypothetical protein